MKSIALPIAIILLAVRHVSGVTLISTLGQTAFSQDGSGGGPAELMATDFLTGASATSVTGTTVNIGNGDNISHTYTVSIYNNGAGVPTTLLGSFTGISLGAGAAFANVSATSPGISLAANSTYWEVVKMNENPNLPVTLWTTTNSPSADSGGLFTLVGATQPKLSLNSGSTWSNNGSVGANHVFSLSGVTVAPEPSRFVLSIGGLSFLLLARRRRV